MNPWSLSRSLFLSNLTLYIIKLVKASDDIGKHTEKGINRLLNVFDLEFDATSADANNCHYINQTA